MTLHTIRHSAGTGKSTLEAVKTVGPVGELFAGREYRRRQLPDFLHQRLRIASQGGRRVMLSAENGAGGIARECGTETEQGFRLLLWGGVSQVISTEDVLVVCRAEFAFRKQGGKNSIQTLH